MAVLSPDIYDIPAFFDHSGPVLNFLRRDARGIIALQRIYWARCTQTCFNGHQKEASVLASSVIDVAAKTFVDIQSAIREISVGIRVSFLYSD